MKKITKIFYGIVILLSIFIFSNVFADVGNFNSYDSGDSSSSWSSSSSSWGSSSSDSGYSDSSSSSSGGLSGIMVFLSIFTFIFLIIIFSSDEKNYYSSNKYRSNNSYGDLKPNPEDRFEPQYKIVERIKADDPNFSKEVFLSFASEVFVKLQNAWTARDWKQIRVLESNELFNQHNNQLKQYIDNNKINVIERLCVKNTCLKDYRVEGDKEIIEVYLMSSMQDYVIDATTKELLEGVKDRIWNMNYILTFARKKGVKTKIGAKTYITTNCPNCGAPTEVTSAGQCEYCGSVIITGEHDFVLIDLKKA